jgi:hypothetical protein
MGNNSLTGWEQPGWSGYVRGEDLFAHFNVYRDLRGESFIGREVDLLENHGR